MHILDKIVAHKKIEVQASKARTQKSMLEKAKHFNRSCHSLKASIKDTEQSGVIAEFKRKSPSKKDINLNANLTEVVSQYENALASGISILTDEKFFGGTLDYLEQSRALVNTPLLRKEFIIDEYQIIEAKAFGADAILLIARILNKSQLESFSQTAKNLGLEVLVEIHNEAELQKLPIHFDVVGINNRDLDTFEVNYERSVDLLHQLPKESCKISESGIHDIDTMLMLHAHGFHGFLIGERFMKNENPGLSCQEILSDYMTKRNADAH